MLPAPSLATEAASHVPSLVLPEGGFPEVAAWRAKYGDTRNRGHREGARGAPPPNTPTAEAPLDAAQVGQLLARIEQQWGQEIRTLKEELHQTILAHNHNADLIKHHKDCDVPDYRGEPLFQACILFFQFVFAAATCPLRILRFFCR